MMTVPITEDGAKSIIHADDELARKALAFPHPDSVVEEKLPSDKNPWWRIWKS
jgi:hypothetical protein